MYCGKFWVHCCLEFEDDGVHQFVAKEKQDVHSRSI